MPYSARIGYTGSSTRVLLPRRPVPPPIESSSNSTEFAEASDRLVRHLFDVGLQLHHVLDAIDPAAPPVVRDTVNALIDDLDMLIRDTGLAMLALAGESQAAPQIDGRLLPGRIRRR
ncbi:hypothetical protein [Nocardia sp. NPDC049149]|uniref:hypothetical protein n=1 Tax=Nocardia sp. NPDC049149 TaxID=3364315 RepID=UPI003711502F